MSKKVDLAAALRVIEAAREKAEEIGVPMDIAVVDEGANLVAFQRMDGALLGAVDIAMNKAYTACSLKTDTGELAKIAQPGQPVFGVHISNQGRIIIFAGGVPIKDGEKVVGAIGVSSGSLAQDQAVAEAGIAAF
ncbi:MAG TPA: heme-binding protein [Atribacteraceae bacterium]|nr:heme-binding protein [Atribacteraceae bacterium]